MSQYKLIGHIYTEPMEVFLLSGLTYLKEGDKLITTQNVFDEADLHYFRKDPKKIKEGKEVTVVGCWINFYGEYVRCEYKGEKYDIKPKYLKIKK